MKSMLFKFVFDDESEEISPEEVANHLDIGLRRVKEDLLDRMKYHVLSIEFVDFVEDEKPWTVLDYSGKVMSQHSTEEDAQRYIEQQEETNEDWKFPLHIRWI